MPSSSSNKITPTTARAPVKAASREPVKAPRKGLARTPARSMPPKPIGKNPSSPLTSSKRPSVSGIPSAPPHRPVLTSTRSNSTSSKAVASTKSPQVPKSENWVNRSVQNRIQGWGDYAGSLLSSVGGSVNRVGQGVGDSITNVTRGWGQGVAGYGNDIKDAVEVGGPRVPTGGNPLGLAGRGGAKNLRNARKPQRGALGGRR